MTTNGPVLFIDVTTRSATDPDEPPRRDRINYGSDRARKWLITHTYWALYNGYTVHTAPCIPPIGA